MPAPEIAVEIAERKSASAKQAAAKQPPLMSSKRQSRTTIRWRKDFAAKAPKPRSPSPREAIGLGASGSVFISYRREVSAGFAGRIYDRVASHLGRERVFFDVDNIRPSLDFVRILSEQVSACEALVAIIGRGRLTTIDEHNRNALMIPTISWVSRSRPRSIAASELFLSSSAARLRPEARICLRR